MMRRLFSDENEPFYRSAKTMEIGPIPVALFGEFVRAQFDAPSAASATRPSTGCSG